MNLPSPTDIRNALELESASLPQYFSFEIVSQEKEAGIWKVKVDVTHSRSTGLDESLEGARAWWAGEPNGSADVLAALPDEETLHLRFATAEPPGTGNTLRIYPPRYLDPLLAYWRSTPSATQSLEWLDQGVHHNQLDEARLPDASDFPWLRDKQRQAFKLPGWKLSYLWGPPGTGKTTTLGAMLASYLVKYPQRRVLLLSTTNVAVDLALVSVDRQLESLGSRGHEARQACKRLGTHFAASHYQGRAHLLPAQKPELIQELNDLESNPPDKSNAPAHAAWKSRVEAVRKQMRAHTGSILETNRLVALTVARGIFTRSDLSQFAPYDLVLFDEASQVGIPAALALAPLGQHVLLAGDPMQLAPIARAKDERVQKLLGSSMFEYMEDFRPWCRMLDEQSRMVGPICQIVGDLFYRGRLKVARDTARKAIWSIERAVHSAPRAWRTAIKLVNIASEGTWSQRYKGPIRHESAEKLCEIVQALTQGEPAENILILTPFRAQRSLARGMLRAKRLPKVKVSTVHRAQGSEHHTVLFDPVQGQEDFLKTQDARRLVNVAISRAAARLVVLLSPGDRSNDLLNNLGTLIERAHIEEAEEEYVPLAPASLRRRDEEQGIISIADLNQRPDFPNCALHKHVRIKNQVGRITKILEDGAKFEFQPDHGEATLFLTKFVRRIH